ncbi:MAG: Gfo/Idh/MocA family oxidoreductase [Promethearchaeia archaeon]
MDDQNTDREPITAVMMGAGTRGRHAYGAYGQRHPKRINFIAIAEPDIGKREKFQEEHNISDELAFKTWEDLLDQGKIADAAFICMGDRLHYEPAMKAMDLGYHLLLEKPIAPTLQQCQDLENKANQTGVIVQVGHVLRFHPFWKKVNEVIKSGRIGDVIHYEHSENVSYWHFGHSYVRGFYKNKAESNPLILAKSCHDLDLMYWNLGEPQEVKAMGDLTFYKEENAPADAPDRCTDGCPHAEECAWYAPRLYMRGEELIRIGTESDSRLLRFGANLALNHRKFVKFLSFFIPRLRTVLNWQYFPAIALGADLSPEAKMKALREGQFGKCIYKCGNDVVDHIVATFQFPSGTTGTLTVHGLSEHEGRELRIFGTKGTLRGYFRHYGEKIWVTDFRYRNEEVVYESGASLESHGGSDFLLMDQFTAVLLGEKTAEEAGLTTLSSAMESHYMGFAAQNSMEEDSTKNLEEFRPL